MEALFSINSRKQMISFQADQTLLSVLRENGHTEVKEGCLEGSCGTCVVFLDGVLVNSCQVLAASAAGRDITTVKGLGDIHTPHPIQKAFVNTGAVQCGYCTPGMVLAAYALLKKIPCPDEHEIKRALDGNLCRCTGYVKIIEAVKLAALRMQENG